MKKAVCINTFYPPYDEASQGKYRYRIWEGSTTAAGFLMQFFLNDIPKEPDCIIRMLNKIKRNTPFATNLFYVEFQEKKVLMGYEYEQEKQPIFSISKANLLDGIRQWIQIYHKQPNRMALELSSNNKIKVYIENGFKKDIWGHNKK